MGMDHFGVKVGALLSSIAEKGLVSQNGHFSNFLNFQTLSGSRAKLRKVEKGKIIRKILLRVCRLCYAQKFLKNVNKQLSFGQKCKNKNFEDCILSVSLEFNFLHLKMILEKNDDLRGQIQRGVESGWVPRDPERSPFRYML